MGWSWPEHKQGRGQGPESCTTSSAKMKEFGLSDGGTKPQILDINFEHPLFLFLGGA